MDCPSLAVIPSLVHLLLNPSHTHHREPTKMLTMPQASEFIPREALPSEPYLPGHGWFIVTNTLRECYRIYASIRFPLLTCAS
jgi:hypothetical protein